MPDSPLFETEHLKVLQRDYVPLVKTVIDESIRSMMINRPPRQLAMENVKDAARMHASSGLRRMIDSLNVITRKPSSKDASKRVVKEQALHLVRKIRLYLYEDLVNSKEEIFLKTRKRAIKQADYAILKVLGSSVELLRLERARTYGRSTDGRTPALNQ
jgi:hypothetical protein